MTNAIEAQPAIITLSPEQEAADALNRAMEVLTLAKSVVIHSDADYSAADSAVAAIKNAKKQAEAKRTDLVKPLNDTVKKINDGFKPVAAAFDEALECYRRPMTAYQAELARQRAEAEAAARKERERLEAEARAKAEAEMEAARKARDEAEAAKQAAASDDPFEALLAADDLEEAERRAAEQAEAAKQAIRDIRTIEVHAAPVPAKVTGSASKTHTVYGYEIEDESKIEDRYWVLDHAAIARDVKALKGDFNSPGIKVTSRIEVR